MKPAFAPPPRALGFTLIELLITVAIVGILVSIAYPAYESAMQKSRRTQARAALADLMLQQERYMAQFNCYAAFSTSVQSSTFASTVLGGDADECATPDDVPFKNFAGDSAAKASHILSAVPCPNMTASQCIQLTATPLHPDLQVGALRLTSMGAKSCTGTAATTQPDLCWP